MFVYDNCEYAWQPWKMRLRRMWVHLTATDNASAGKYEYIMKIIITIKNQTDYIRQCAKIRHVTQSCWVRSEWGHGIYWTMQAYTQLKQPECKHANAFPLGMRTMDDLAFNKHTSQCELCPSDPRITHRLQSLKRTHHQNSYILCIFRTRIFGTSFPARRELVTTTRLCTISTSIRKELLYTWLFRVCGNILMSAVLLPSPIILMVTWRLTAA